jgi:hypothetical protein
MIKTQIQLPDALYRALKRIAKEREMSMAELLRRGAEYITQVYLPVRDDAPEQTLPGPFNLGVKQDPFANPNWRYELHTRTEGVSAVRETRKARVGGSPRKKR